MTTGIQPATDQERRLRACIRDLRLLSAIPAECVGRGSAEVVDHSCGLLRKILGPDSVLVEVRSWERIESPFPDGVTAVSDGLRIVTYPIGRSGELGRLTVGSKRTSFPDEHERLLLQMAAGQVALALRQVHLLRFHERSEQRLKLHAAQQAAVAAFGLRALGRAWSDELVDDALSCVLRTLRMDLADILEASAGGTAFRLRAGAGWSSGVVGGTETFAESLAGCTLLAGEPVVVHDFTQEPRFRGATRFLEHGVVSGVNVIIHGRRHPYGVLGAYSRAPRALTSDEVHFLQGIANVLAASIQRHDHEAEREELLVRTRRAVAARDRAVSIVSHDLGNPLGTIQICANALLDTADPPSAAGMRSMARIIQRSVALMQQIAQDLLDRTSLDTGRLVLERQATAISDIIGAVETLFAPVAREHEVEFVVVNGSDLPLIHADPRRLLQILSNLLGNAMKFTPARGRVELSAQWAEMDAAHARTAPGRGVRFQVADTGPGIPARDLGHIFDWFWHTETPGGSGNGMGLAIAGGLVAAHGARLNVRSEPGHGSAFWFTIPAIGGGAP